MKMQVDLILVDRRVQLRVEDHSRGCWGGEVGSTARVLKGVVTRPTATAVPLTSTTSHGYQLRASGVSIGSSIRWSQWVQWFQVSHRRSLREVPSGSRVGAVGDHGIATGLMASRWWMSLGQQGSQRGRCGVVVGRGAIAGGLVVMMVVVVWHFGKNWKREVD